MRMLCLLVLLTACPSVQAGVSSPPVAADPDEPRVSTLPKSGAGSLVRRCDAPCPEGRVCVEVEVHCMRAPCPPVQRCLRP
jgi:hypothetical protein